mgnify:CR=1 FL=1|jgi:hypothetical protein|tara:strand:+ start:1553 stop:2383 length:831 start_codon:yes stop_codon:yes gene_type:complete
MINYLKDQYYWYNINQKLNRFLKGKEDEKILMYGYPKSGNTWLRFLLYNYCNLLLNNEEVETISYNRLNILQNNIMDRGTTFLPEKGFPLFYRTHRINKRTYNLFDKKIFIHRNPLDTLISSYYFFKDREVPFYDDPKNLRDKLHNVDFYITYKIDEWIHFFNTSVKCADIVMNYSNIKLDAEKELTELINFLEWNLDTKLIKKSVRFSSFNEVKKMGREKMQKYGNGPKDGRFKGEFTRSGKEGQFYTELKKETINSVLNKFPEFNNLYPDLIEK